MTKYKKEIRTITGDITSIVDLPTFKTELESEIQKGSILSIDNAPCEHGINDIDIEIILKGDSFEIKIQNSSNGHYPYEIIYTKT